MSLLDRWRRKPARKGVVGLELRGDGVAMVRLSASGPEDAGRLDLCEFRPCEDAAELPAVLAAAVRDHGLAGMRCVAVLPPGRYGLRLLDAPDVEPDELPAAAHWLVKDLIDFPIEEAVVDQFPLPEKPGRPSRLYVATARSEVVQRVVSAVEEAGLALAAVEVGELALRNLAARVPEDEQGLALLRLGRRGGLLSMTQGGSLYLARGVETGLDALVREPVPDPGTPGAEDPGAFDLGPGIEEPAANEAFDGLVLEIQRSLDYYESQLGQTPIAQLALAPLEEPVPGLLPYLEKHLSTGVRGLALDDLVPSDALPESLQGRCLAALGGALRNDAGDAAPAQQVDLYQLRFQKVRPPFAAALMAAGLAGVVALLGAVWGLAAWRNAAAVERVETLRAERGAESTRVTELATLYPAAEVDPALEARVADLEQERAAKLRLLGLLSNQSLGNTRGFSGHVTGIARRRVDGLWLRTVRIEAGGGELVLEGSALDAAQVPRFLQALGDEDAFAGSEFRSLRMERSIDQPGRIDWSARTRAEDDDAGEEPR